MQLCEFFILFNVLSILILVREGHLRVEQVSAAELKVNDVDIINTSNISTASGQFRL